MEKGKEVRKEEKRKQGRKEKRRKGGRRRGKGMKEEGKRGGVGKNGKEELSPLLAYTQSVYDFAMTCEQLPHHLTLVTNFPRKELVCDEEGGPQLQDLGLGRRCILFVQDNSEDD